MVGATSRLAMPIHRYRLSGCWEIDVSQQPVRSLFVLGLATTSAWAEQSPTQAYLQARDTALDAIQAAYKKDMAAGDARAKREVPGLQDKLRKLIGPIGIPGFQEQSSTYTSPVNPTLDGSIPLDSLSVASLDGKTHLMLSTRPLWQAWVNKRRQIDGASFILPHDAAKALTSEALFSETFGERQEAAAYKFAELPVTAHTKGATTGAILLSHAQDEVAPHPPELIGIAIIQGDRILIFEQPAQVAQIPACKAAYERKPDTDRAFEDCFAQKLPEQADYPALVRQAQTLVNQALGML
jgi:hypothetical protein